MRQTTFTEERKDIVNRLSQLKENRHAIALLLDHVQDERNIAALFRLSDAANLKKIYFYSSELELEKQIKSKKLGRIARSSMQYVPYESIEDVKKLKEEYHFVAIEITDQSIPYHQYQLPQKAILLILGNEKYGVSKELLALAEDAVHLPMYGINTSMNVAMSAAIVSYHFVNLLLAKA